MSQDYELLPGYFYIQYYTYYPNPSYPNLLIIWTGHLIPKTEILVIHQPLLSEHLDYLNF